MPASASASAVATAAARRGVGEVTVKEEDEKRSMREHASGAEKNAGVGVGGLVFA